LSLSCVQSSRVIVQSSTNILSTVKEKTENDLSEANSTAVGFCFPKRFDIARF